MSPLAQEEEASPSAPKKINMKTLVKRIRRKKVIRKVIPFPSVPNVIPKEEEENDEDEEDNVRLSQMTHIARATEVE